MAVTPRPQVLDSAQFVAHEYDTDLFAVEFPSLGEEGETVRVVRAYDCDVLDDMHRAATRLLREALRTYWAARGYLLLDASRDAYHRVTGEDGEVRVGSVLIPSAEDAAEVWRTVVAGITADDIEQEARRPA